MKIELPRQRACRLFVAAFSLVEVMVGMCTVSITFVSLYLGFSSGFALIQVTREDLRATQILQEKMETIRLYNWDQINTPGFIPTSFISSFYATNADNIVSLDGSTPPTNVMVGLVYRGHVVITNVNITNAGYTNDLRKVIVRLEWRSGAHRERVQEISTFVSRYGLQNYLY